MKAIFLSLGLFLGISYVNCRSVTNWGLKQDGDLCGSVYVNLMAPFDEALQKTLIFPQVIDRFTTVRQNCFLQKLSSMQTPNEHLVINEIVHVDYKDSPKSNVTIIDGGIGESFVRIRITSEVGQRIRSTLKFNYHLNEPQLGLLELDEFLETNIVIGD